MNFELKTLSPEALPAALEKAHLYRLLHEPGEAESICRDVLEVEPENQDALITLLLALTDQFDTDGPSAVTDANAVIERLPTRTRARTTRASSTSAAQRRSSVTACLAPVPGCTSGCGRR